MTMKITSALVRLLALALSFATLTATADTLFSVSDQISGTDPTQLGRLSRNNVPQDWGQSEPFPGVINAASTYRYRAYTINVGLTPFVQVSLDSTATTTFVAAYLGSYAPNSAGAPGYGFDTTWLGDAGFSGNVFGVDPVFFGVQVPPNSTIVVVIAETTPGAGVGQPYNLLVEGFTDRVFGVTASANTTVSVASSANPAAAGRNVTLTATVTDTTPPQGSVRFNDGAAVIAGCGGVALTGSGLSKTATCVTQFAPGAHNITATYLGNPRTSNPVTSPVLVQNVNALVVTTTTVTSSPNPSLSGRPVIFNVSVAGSAPTGTVAFTDSVTAAVLPGCSAVALTGTGDTRVASCTASLGALGAHTVTATYSGDAANATSNGNVVQTVNPCTLPRGCPI